MYKYLKLSVKNTNSNLVNQKLNKFFFSLLSNNANKANIQATFFNNGIIKVQNKNIFSKFFNKDKNEEESDEKKINIDNLRLQDKRGKFSEGDQERKPSEGEYNFSHNTEIDYANENEDAQFEESDLNPENSVKFTFSKKFLQVEENKFKKTSESVKEETEENNFNKLANLIDFKLNFTSQHLIKKYNSLNFQEEILPVIQKLRDLGFDNNLLRSIFRKKYKLKITD